MHEWLAWLGNVLTVVIGFGFLIFVHEFGHFIVAKWKGVKVIKFSLGFGPALVHFRKGETEYALSAVPLGGFCKLAGEFSGENEEEKTDEPPTPPERLLGSKSVGARAQIFVAGALMNLIVAFPLGVAMVMIGGYEPISKVSVAPGPAFEAGMHSGDLVTQVNGKPVHYFFEMQDAIQAVPDKGTVKLTVSRKTDGGAPIQETHDVTRKEADDYLGLVPFPDRRLWFVHPKERTYKAGLRSRDEVISVAKEGGEPIPVNDSQDFQSIVSASPGEKLTVVVQRESKEEGTVTLTKKVTPKAVQAYGIGAELSERPVIDAVQGESPAREAGLKAGDRIVQVGAIPIISWRDILGAIHAAGTSVPMKIARDGQTLDITVVRPSAKALIGIAPSDSPLLVVSITRSSPAEKAGLQPGDELLKVDKQPASAQVERYAGLLPDNKNHDLLVRRDGKEFTVTVGAEARDIGRVGVTFMPASEFRRPPTFGAAISEGTRKTSFLFIQTFKTLYGLFAGKVSTSELAGPVGIATLSYGAAAGGWEDFIRFMMMITVSLGVLNLLPVPVLDGGHLFFLLIEKIKGKPVSEHTMAVAQYVGLALLIGLVLYVTTNDVMGFIL